MPIHGQQAQDLFNDVTGLQGAPTIHKLQCAILTKHVSRYELTLNQAEGKRREPRISVGKRKAPCTLLRARRGAERESAGISVKAAAVLVKRCEYSRVENTDQRGKHENA
jgi:hypothetical protein